ncbi:MAG: DEAD/DEAH box helicase [Pseudomonadota bacterium]
MTELKTSASIERGSQPISASTPAPSGFDGFGLAKPILRALADQDFTTPTPIQQQTIPAQMQGRDVMGLAQTGTGKTAAFGLPLVHHLDEEGARPQPKRPRALILAPTRELAVQIDENLRGFARHIRFSTTLVLGGVPKPRQIKALARGVDVLVATPGRLIDLMNDGHVILDSAHYLVVDEADRMLDMGFVRDMRRILGRLPNDRQSLMFSATMPREVEDLAAEFLYEPVRVEVAPQSTTAEKIKQRVDEMPSAEKRGHLARLFDDPAFERVIVFTRTKHGANKVAKNLTTDGVPAEAIHGNKSQSARQRALGAFRTGEARVLVATDIAARGIDVPEITHVINYDLPDEPEAYVHRIGRTARAGRTGMAITLYDPREERGKMRDVEKVTRQKLVDHPAGAPRKGEDEGPKGGARGRPMHKRGGGGGRPEGQRPPRNRGPRQDGGQGRPARRGGRGMGGAR